MWEKIYNFIVAIEPLLLVIIPACFGVYMKVKKKVTEKKIKIVEENEKENKEKFSDWEHKESMAVVDKIKTICNYYKDIGYMDLVSYVQFENGTTSTSKLCNMFLSCLAEDSRFGKIPKMIASFQRIPYSRLSYWVNNVINAQDNLYIVNDIDAEFADNYSDLIIGSDKVKSFISGPVRDPNGMLIGICTFYFAEKGLCNKNSEETCKLVMTKFINSIETIFVEYHTARKRERKKLNIK